MKIRKHLSEKLDAEPVELKARWEVSPNPPAPRRIGVIACLPRHIAQRLRNAQSAAPLCDAPVTPHSVANIPKAHVRGPSVNELNVTHSILQVGRNINGTGGGRVVVETSLRMHRCGKDVCVLTDSPAPSLEDHGIRVVVTPLGPLLMKWKPRMRALRVVRHFVQLVAFSFFGWYRARTLRSRGAVVINHNLEIFGGDVLVFHNVFRAEYEDREAYILARLRRWLNPVFSFRLLREWAMLRWHGERVLAAVSRAAADDVKRYLAQDDAVHVVPNGVNTKAFTPNNTLICNCASPTFNLLFVGHEFKRKGLAYAIEALASLPDSVTLDVLGGGSESAVHDYRMLAEYFGVSERVVFHGTVSNTAMYYRAANVFVLPTDYEAWPLVGLEAMACGTPILMTDVGGIREYLENGINGYFIKRNAKDIVQKVRWLLDNHSEFEQMRAAARATAEHYSWDVTTNGYLELVERVAARKHSCAT